MTYAGGRAIRFPLLAIAATALLAGLWAAALDAPGPPAVLIEPRTGMVLVALEPGTFTMGSPPEETGRQPDEVAREVTLTRRVYIGRHEVTQTEWAIIMRNDPSDVSGCGRCPVENVDLFQVGDFIVGLNAQSTSVRYRLPTEAEWEYACRAGLPAPTASRTLSAFDRVTPVGGLPPNAWGLYDMLGNVAEWTADWYAPYDPAAAVDPRGAHGGALRVIRGGGWGDDASRARCAARATQAPHEQNPRVGFRVVAEASPRRTLDIGDYRNR